MPKVKMAAWQYAAMNNPFHHFAMYGGVAVGKTFTGSHFAIQMITRYPNMTGFIGANTYDQLSQATIKEFFEWLAVYNFEYVIDRLPPPAWNYPRNLKSYRNTVLIRNRKTKKVSLVFTRVLSDGNPLRGIEFSWYWLDETRDTPEDTHDVVISRMRETKNFMKGLITTTTNGEDWSFKRFVRGQDKTKLYGSMHVPSKASLDVGIITPIYYNSMAKSYSPMMALQELEAKHVNVLGGKAYYAASDRNRQRFAPWGDTEPNPERPLIVGCDFNFQPAPCCWVVGQLGPNMFAHDGTYWGDHIHWFAEIKDVEVSSVQMTEFLLSRYPGFFYEIYGDVSGGMGTTSNAGITDYDQIGERLHEADALFSIDYWQEEDRQNPKVKNRVENMNQSFCNYAGEVKQTYDPVLCPLLDGDIKMVGWTQHGKLDSGGDVERTHASDAAGYAVYKIRPPGRQSDGIINNPSTIREDYGLIG